MCNPIKPEGAKALALALVDNRTLSELSLYDCQIESTGIHSFCVYLPFNRSISTLIFGRNKASPEVLKSLQKLLKRNFLLLNIDLLNDKKSMKYFIRNTRISRRVYHNWARVCIEIAFIRANYSNALKYSILPLVPEIIHMLHYYKRAPCPPSSSSAAARRVRHPALKILRHS
eukprot:TRINITY_DN11706_c0_g1_i1.p1 TRINITY_DN11706_c0_g1~~TRINITY_DN11706_c0_g1_i1.p1  ORF type:complete len:173 (+),score=40.50 TRINITY_DN11706_c0_g1_i1:172-690(+)